MYQDTMNYVSVQNNFIKSHSFLLQNTDQTHYAENNNQLPKTPEKSVEEVWSKHNFDLNKVKVEHLINLNVKTMWSEEKSEEKLEREDKKEDEKEDIQNASYSEEKEETSPSHHARRPPNAFLIFCKKHRPVVRQRYPNLENRGVTKILGEWWALLESSEKQPYNDLAKEYKDAFLSANPNFRWYKLPAPPLRTLSTRPTPVVKVSTPLASPTSLEFTPGKLADETQLGGLTSLMGNFASTPKIEKKEDNNNVEKAVNCTVTSLPPKKRVLERFEGAEEDERGGEEMTNQDLLDKVVDGMFAKQTDDSLKEVRKSDRVCKGKRYEIFMMEGKLLGNKRDSRLTQHNKQCKIESRIEEELTVNKQDTTPKLDLENTIKRLAERTNTKIDFDQINNKPERVRSVSESSNSSLKSSSSVGNFNLDLRITNLTGLSYDEFVRRKRENKKRKLKIKTNDHDAKAKMQKISNEKNLVGSKKRKNKMSITHLNKTEERNNDLIGLETLAMVAANTEKISE